MTEQSQFNAPKNFLRFCILFQTVCFHRAPLVKSEIKHCQQRHLLTFDIWTIHWVWARDRWKVLADGHQVSLNADLVILKVIRSYMHYRSFLDLQACNPYCDWLCQPFDNRSAGGMRKCCLVGGVTILQNVDMSRPRRVSLNNPEVATFFSLELLGATISKTWFHWGLNLGLLVFRVSGSTKKLLISNISSKHKHIGRHWNWFPPRVQNIMLLELSFGA